MYKGKHYKKESLSERILSIPFFDCIRALVDYHNQWWDRVEKAIGRLIDRIGNWFKED